MQDAHYQDPFCFQNEDNHMATFFHRLNPGLSQSHARPNSGAPPSRSHAPSNAAR